MEAIRAYSRDIGQVDRLTEDEKLALWRRWKDGDRDALAELTRALARTVMGLVKKYRHLSRRLESADLVGAGNLGMLEAIHKYDPNRGVPLSLFVRRVASWRMSRETQKSQRGTEMVSLEASTERDKSVLEVEENPSAVNPLREVIRREERELARRYLEVLEPYERELMRGWFFRGQLQSEIAREHEATEIAVQKKLRRVILGLRTMSVKEVLELTREPLVTREEAAEFLGVTRDTMATWAVNGRHNLPVLHVGRRCRYRVSDLKAFKESREACVA